MEERCQSLGHFNSSGWKASSLTLQQMDRGELPWTRGNWQQVMKDLKLDLDLRTCSFLMPGWLTVRQAWTGSATVQVVVLLRVQNCIQLPLNYHSITINRHFLGLVASCCNNLFHVFLASSGWSNLWWTPPVLFMLFAGGRSLNPCARRAARWWLDQNLFGKQTSIWKVIFNNKTSMSMIDNFDCSCLCVFLGPVISPFQVEIRSFGAMKVSVLFSTIGPGG